MEPRRCGVHGLVVGDDGRCVICRRGEEVVEAKTSSDWPVVVFVVVLSALVLGGAGLWLFERLERMDAAGTQAVAEVVVADEATSTPTPPPKPTPKRRPAPAAVESAPPPPDPAEVEKEEKAKLEAAMKQVPIVMYRRQRCSQCDRAKLQIQKNGWLLEELDVGSSETDLVLLKSVNPSGSVPTFDVAGRILVAYERDALVAAVEAEAKKKLAAPKRPVPAQPR
jgi:glutaredoxin